MQIHETTLYVLLAGSLGVSGCQHASPRIGGTSSMQVLEPVPVAVAEPNAGEERESGVKMQFREARLRGKAVQPAYPTRAFAANVGVVHVAVRVVVDAQGRVADIQPSVRAATLVPARFAEYFWAEIEMAVRQWVFAPARMDQIETIKVEGFSYDRVRQSANVETELDLVFTFKPS